MPSILITGVSSGIGLALADLYAERGWSVTGTVRDAARHPEGLDDRVTLERLDLARVGDASELCRRILAAGACPDVLVNNAGTLAFGPLEASSTEEFERVYRVNVFEQLELARGLLPSMRARRSGTVANVTSLGGTMTFPFFAVYNSSKWALEGVSEGLWHELKPFGVRVKLIEPGYVATAIWDKVLPESRKASDVLTAESSAYGRFVQSMLDFEAGVTNRTSPDAAAREIAAAIDDESNRLRYPVAAYARPLVRARRLFGAQQLMRFFHRRWMGPESG